MERSLDEMNINGRLYLKEPDIDKVCCKDCMFREPDRVDGKIKGATLMLCDMYPNCTKPPEIIWEGVMCPYYVSEGEDPSGYLSIWSAYLYALKKHGDQKDRAGKPYILHPVHVAVYTAELTSDPEIITAAMLHDTIEDTDATLEEIRELFGDRVEEIVDRMSRREGEDYYDYVRRAAENPDAVLVKRSDLRHNMDLSRFEHPTEKDYKRMKKYQKALDILNEKENA
ncbi:MAG: HD domain-containing protein [Eubacterium sp.]|jgi:hypothetical protein